MPHVFFLQIVSQANIYQQKEHQPLIANAKHARMDNSAQIKIEIIVENAMAEKVIKSIKNAAYSGKIGDGKIFVSDGYGNRRVHRFSKEGEHEISWGEHGTSEGKFSIVHKLGVSKDNRVFVCDRENDRIQIFSPDGELIDIWTNGLAGPGDIYFQDDIVYVVEQSQGSGISIWNLSGDLITRWRGVPEVCEAVHGCAVDSKGNITKSRL